MEQYFGYLVIGLVVLMVISLAGLCLFSCAKSWWVKRYGAKMPPSTDEK